MMNQRVTAHLPPALLEKLQLGYAWPPEQREAMLAMEQAVYAEMRTW
jgi:hypothetical protein